VTYDHWKTTNPDDEWIGPEPPPCLPQRTSRGNYCADCGAPEGECWWDAPELATCDCCDKSVPAEEISRCWAYGIETFACEECRS
jgi:hypothetical protein